MNAIETRRLAPTDTKPSRILAETGNGHRMILSVSSAEAHVATRGWADTTENADRIVAQALADKLQWTGRLACGSTKSGHVFVFVFDDSVNPQLPHVNVTETRHPEAARRP